MIGVIIVTFNGAGVIEPCLKSLFEGTDQEFRVVIVDNNSADNTVETIRKWVGAFHAPRHEGQEQNGNSGLLLREYTVGDDIACNLDAFGDVTILQTGANLGFAGGVNAGIRAILPVEAFDLFWVLNPDTVVAPDTVAVYRKLGRDDDNFSLMGCRILFLDTPDRIQSDGSTINRWTGVCSNLNRAAPATGTPLPPSERIDYLSGSNMVASRRFLETAGLMREDYFLYYEEVDWAFQRGALPLKLTNETFIYHHGGATIGSGNLTSQPNAFANYFNFRNRIRFIARHFPLRLPVALTYNALKIIQIMLKAGPEPAIGALRGMLQLSPTAAIRNRIAEKDRPLAFTRFSA